MPTTPPADHSAVTEGERRRLRRLARALERERLAAIPVTDDDLAVLRGEPLFRPPPASGYVGVYRKSPASGVWQARPCSGGRREERTPDGAVVAGAPYTTGGDRKGGLSPRVLLGNFKSPREAARVVVQWWKAQYGEQWVAMFKARTVNPWFARRAAGGWQLVVRPPGKEERVVPPPDGAALFPDRESAAAYFRVWAEREFRGAAWRALRAGGVDSPGVAG